MADLKRIAQLLRMLGSSGGERRNAFTALERTMHSEGKTWSDIGNIVEQHSTEGKYSEAELQELYSAARKEGVEAGIKIGMARASNGAGNGAGALPSPIAMAAYCHQRRDRLNEWEREFVDDMHVGGKARRFTLSTKQKTKLQDIYQQLGGT